MDLIEIVRLHSEIIVTEQTKAPILHRTFLGPTNQN